MVDVISPALAIRSSVGIELRVTNGPKLPYEHQPNLPLEQTKHSRSICFSANGRFFAYSNGQVVKVLNTVNWEPQCSLPRPKASFIEFSPKGTYLCTWELCTVTKDRKEGLPNMFVYDVSTGQEVFSVIQKNQTDWTPSWSVDETIFAIVVGGEASFYEVQDAAGFSSPVRRIGGLRGGMLSLGPNHNPPHITLYYPGGKNSPSMCKLYLYPALNPNQVLAFKSFFQADRVEMLWNKRGSGVLLLTSTEVDKSGSSYYGNQALHFMGTNSDTCSVSLSKEGPVHCVKWSPKANEFIVVYGLMPSKAALYNIKCDVIFDFGEGPRNCAYFNAFGNLVVLAGFGNLPGNIEVWDMVKKERLTNIKVPDTTYFEWHPNGELFVTATTAPRLRTGNGFKVYHYSGALMNETIWPEGQELLEVKWQQFSENTFSEPTITKKKQEGIKSSQPEASINAYTPPHLRLLKEGKDPKKYLPQPMPPISGPSTDKNKKSGGNKNNNSQKGTGTATSKIKSNDTHNENSYDNAEHNTGTEGVETSARSGKQRFQTNFNQRQQNIPRTQRKIPHEPGNDSKNKSIENEKGSITDNDVNQHDQNHPETSKGKTVHSEREKKVRNVAKKLSEIKKLKARQDKGETLELNQLNKISQEAKFLEELKILKMWN